MPTIAIIRVPSAIISQADNGNEHAVETIGRYRAVADSVLSGKSNGVMLPSDRDEHGQLLYDVEFVEI